MERELFSALKRVANAQKAAQYHEEALAIIAFRSLASYFIAKRRKCEIVDRAEEGIAKARETYSRDNSVEIGKMV